MNGALVPTRDTERWSLEAQADALLKEAGEHMDGLDFTKGHRLFVKADPITRVTLHTMPMSPDDWKLAQQAIERRWNGRSVADRRAIVAHSKACKPYRVRSAQSPTSTTFKASGWLLPVTVMEYRTELVNGGYAWVGHKRVPMGAIGDTHKARTARVARVAVGATGKRGKLVSWWSCSERSLPRLWSKATDDQRATADTLESMLRTNAHDRPLIIGKDANGRDHVIVADTALAMVRRDHPDSRSFPVREYARRAALSGLTLD